MLDGSVWYMATRKYHSWDMQDGSVRYMARIYWTALSGTWLRGSTIAGICRTALSGTWYHSWDIQDGSVRYMVP